MSELLSSSEQPLLLDVRAAAQLLGVRRSLVYSLLRSGELRSLTVGRCRRIRRADLDDYIDERAAANLNGPAGY